MTTLIIIYTISVIISFILAYKNSLTEVEWDKFKKNPFPSKKEESKQDWFCPKCNAYVDSKSVTFEETHDLCNTGVIILKEEHKDLNYWRNNAEEDYLKTPISVLRYITELENTIKDEK